MRLMHLIHTPRYSGAESLVAALTRLHAESGHVSAVVAMAPAETDFLSVIKEQSENGINWFFPQSKISKFERVKYFRKQYREFKPDIIFAHSVLPAAYGRLAGLAPVVSVLHDASENDYSSGVLRISELILQFRSAGVIAVSPRAAKNYRKIFKFPKVECVPNGINLEAYGSKERSPKLTLIQELGLPENAIVVLQVGRITAIKQQHLSILAIGELVKQNPNIHLLLAGILENEDSLKRVHEAIIDTGCDRNVHILGPRKDIPKLLAAADLYLMPSFKEAHSVAMIEALVSGVQIVASNIPPFEYAMEYPGVALIPPEDKEKFANAILAAIRNIVRFERDLSGYDIRTTASRYIDFSRNFIS